MFRDASSDKYRGEVPKIVTLNICQRLSVYMSVLKYSHPRFSAILSKTSSSGWNGDPS